MSEFQNIRRIGLKISKDASFEEMQEAMRAALDNHDFQLDKELYDGFINLDKIERERRQSMIKHLGPIYDEYVDRTDAEGIKRKKEINDILHYIQFAGNDYWKLFSVQESPDFIIEINGVKIGLEHTGIFDEEVVAKISIRQNICSKSEAALRQSHMSMTGLINVEFSSEQSQNLNVKSMSIELTLYLGDILEGKASTMPTFIKLVDVKPQNELQVSLLENYFVKDINALSFDKLIAQKEAKINKYKENSGLNLIWLLVIIDGFSEKSAPAFTPEMLPQRKFAFDKIIVYDTFRQVGVSYPPDIPNNNK